MNGYDRLTELYDEDQVEQLERPGELYKVDHSRKGYDNETILVRFVHQEDDLDELKKEDDRALEVLFYNKNTPNQWNIQLFWAYHEGIEIDDSTRSRFESNTQFAIRRCVSADSLGAFLRPLQTVEEDIDKTDLGFERGNLIQEIIEADLGFLFDLNSTSREQRLKRLKQGSTSPAGPVEPRQIEPPHGIIDSIELGSEFRPPAKQRTLDTQPFTLLYGRNGSGKTSLLDAATLGMVGQIRAQNTHRSHHYNGLNVTLTGGKYEPVSLSNKPSDVADRISAWYGFRPKGNADRHIEFYHVNYHEAGSTTRLADPEANLDLEKTIRRSLYGERLSDARNEKKELVIEARRRVDKENKEIKQLESEIEELEQKAELVESLFSTVETAREELSPVMQNVVPSPPSQQQQIKDSETDTEQNEWVKTWTTWTNRLQRLRESLNKLDIAEEQITTPAELSNKLSYERDRTDTAIRQLEQIEKQRRKRTEIKQLREDLEDAGWGATPPTVAFVATILSTNGFEVEDFRTIAKASEEESPKPEETLEEWRTRIKKTLEERKTRLTDKREAIREITNLQARREKLLDEIRSRTEEYLDITDEVEYCPACYIEQTEESIRDREQPTDLLESDSGVPNRLQTEIKLIEDTLNILGRETWANVADEIEIRLSETCDAEDFWEVLQRTITDDAVLHKSSERQVTRFTEALSKEILRVDSDETSATLLSDAEELLTNELVSLEHSVDDFAQPIENASQAVSQLEDRRDQLAVGLQILEDYVPQSLHQHEIRVAQDRQLLQSTKSELQTDAVVVGSVAQINKKIKKAQRDLEQHKKQKQGYKDGIDRLNAVFKRAGGDEKFTEYVREHMSAITTLFQAFQRPYQFKRVLLDDNDEVRVIRRGGNQPEPISDMSSGQRAALALAIFVTNNLIHKHAPPVMLLDEPFAHLDDINTISFFNLLIELATRRDDEQDRQVIFATANEDIADLLERKIGDSPKFKRSSIGE